MKNDLGIVGVVAVGHSIIAQEFLNVVREIRCEPIEQMIALSINYDQDPDKIIEMIQGAVRKVDTGYGVLVLTDMFGGTPSNVSLGLLEENRVEVVSGFNLPMLLKAASVEFRKNKKLTEVALFLKKYGSDNIYVASQLLAERK